MGQLTKCDPSIVHEATRDAERSLLGSILMSGCETEPIINHVKCIVTAEDFHDARWMHGAGNRHARIFAAMLQCSNPHQVAVAREMYRAGKLQAGDCAYLKELVIHCLDYRSYLDWQDYAAAVHGYALQRQIEAANRRGDIQEVQRLAGNVQPKGGFVIDDAP